jgi:hypothetical protein
MYLLSATSFRDKWYASAVTFHMPSLARLYVELREV